MSTEPVETIQRKLQSGYALPPLSIIALKLLELASDEDAPSEEIVKLIGKDPSMSVRLLSLANSAFWGSGHCAATLSSAVMRLGYNQIKMMVLSISLRGAFPMGRVEQFDYELFWRVSLYRALVARALAQHSGVACPEEAFLGGLTMEIGLPILFDTFVKGKSSQFRLEIEPLDELLANERAAFGVDHRQIGYAALEYWKFPEQIVACQKSFGSSEPEREGPDLGTLCELARLFSRILLSMPGAFRTFYTKAEKLLGLDQEEINEIVIRTFTEVEQISQDLKLEINKEKDLMEVMEKANRALVQVSLKVSQCYSPQPVQKPLPSFGVIDYKEKTVTDTLQAVAHEIRNPLTAVGGFARRLAGTLDPGSQAGKYAKVILEEALRLERILSEMPSDLTQKDHDISLHK